MRGNAVRACFWFIALAALLWTFRDLKLGRVLALFAELGPFGVLLAWTPQALGLALETVAWQRIFHALGSRVSYKALVRVRLASEALSLSLPAGALLAEPCKVPLLERHAKLSAPTAVAGILARKCLLLESQGVFIGCAALLGCAALGHGARSHAATFMLVLGGAALVVFSTGVCTRFVFARGRAARSVQRLLERLPSQLLRSKLQAQRESFARTDGDLGKFFRSPLRWQLEASAGFLGVWALESVETYVCLHLLGAAPSFGQVAAVEVSLALVRHLVFVLPAGLGLQDAGYALLFSALGLADATEVVAAFLVLKRAKEIGLIALGFGLLSSDKLRQGLGQSAAAQLPRSTVANGKTATPRAGYLAKRV